MEVDIHILLIRPAGRSFEYLEMENHFFLRSSKPKPRRITLRAESEYPEIFIGSIPYETIATGAKPAVALSVPERFHPICDIQIAQKSV